MPTWSPDGRSIVLRDVDHPRRAHQARAVHRRRDGDADALRRLLPRSGLHAGRIADRVRLRRRRRSALRDHAEHGAGGRASGRRGCARRNQRHQSAEHPRAPLDAVGRRHDDARRRRPRAGAGRISRATIPRASTYVRARPAVDRHQTASIAARSCASQARVRATIRRRPTRFACRPTATRVFVNLQGKHYLVGRPARRTRNGRHPHSGPRRQFGGAGQDDVARRRRLPRVDERRRPPSRGRCGAQFFRQVTRRRRASEESTSSSNDRARARTVRCC